MISNAWLSKVQSKILKRSLNKSQSSTKATNDKLMGTQPFSADIPYISVRIIVIISLHHCHDWNDHPPPPPPPPHRCQFNLTSSLIHLHAKVDRSGDQEVDRSGDLEVNRSGDLEVDRSGYLEVDRSGYLEVDRSGDLEVTQLRHQMEQKAILLRGEHQRAMRE